jgi:hypothetical protein
VDCCRDRSRYTDTVSDEWLPSLPSLDSLTIEYIAVVPTSDLVELIDVMSPHCGEIHIRRRMSNLGPGGPDPFLAAGIVIILTGSGVFGLSFLKAAGEAAGKEAGADLYGALKNLYPRSKAHTILGATYHPYELRTTNATGTDLRFLIEEGIDAEAALLAIPQTIDEIKAPGDHIVQLKWHEPSGRWEIAASIKRYSIG